MYDETQVLLSGLSDRGRAQFSAIQAAGGIRGGDGDDLPVTPPAEGDDGAGDAPGVPEGAPGADAAGNEGDLGDEGDQGPSAPEDLASLDGDDLTSLHNALGEARDELIGAGVRTDADLERVQRYQADRARILEEVNRRIADQQRITEGATSLAEEIAAETPLPSPPVPVASVTPARPSAAAVAAARGAQSAAAQQASAGRPRHRVPLVAAVSSNRSQVGGEMSLADLGEAFDRTKRSKARTVLASVQPFEELGTAIDLPDLLGRGSVEHNSRLIRETREEFMAARAAGDVARMATICGPFDIIRDIPDGFGTSEPVTGIFPARPAGRLAFQFLRSVELSAVAGAVALWDETDQAAVDADDADTWKPCVEIECPTPEEIKAEAVTACLIWDITTEMSNPENVANLMNALAALRARTKEARVLQRIDALSHRYSVDGYYGAAPTLIRALNTAMAQGTFANRIDETRYTAIIPPGAVALLTIDLASRGYETDVTGALEYIRERVVGVSDVVMSLDASAAGEPGLPFPVLPPVGAAPGDLPNLDGTYRVRLVDPADALYSESGQINTGTTTDSRLLRMNKTQYFTEEFLFLAKQGPNPWFSLDVTLCADGSRAGLLEPQGCIS